jgi:hypothetical protein
MGIIAQNTEVAIAIATFLTTLLLLT